MKIYITHIDTACILLEINGYRILTDPTLDNAGGLYHHGYGSFSRKTDNPAVPISDLTEIDLILLSHHQHKDNFDVNGKAFARTVGTVISTKAAREAISGVIGLDDWESHTLSNDKLTNLKVTATPAQHHPSWVPGFLAGKVIGFVITWDEQKNGALYISGDTVYFHGIDEIAMRFKIDVGIFHVGSVQFRYLTAFGRYTMNGNDLVKAAEILQPNKVIPIHHRGWTHFKENESSLRQVIAAKKNILDKSIFLNSGVRTEINTP